MSTLLLLHVIFRHGESTRMNYHSYPHDPHKNHDYEPYGKGRLTQNGRTTSHKFGRTIRHKFGAFLGNYCSYLNAVVARASFQDRSKESLKFVYAGLLKSDMIALPIYDPPDKFKQSEDFILNGVYSPKYQKNLYEVTRNLPIKELEYSNDIPNISFYTGVNIVSNLDILLIYKGLLANHAWGLKLPEWTQYLFPHSIAPLAMNHYHIVTSSPQLRKAAVGHLLQDIVINCFNKILGKIPHNKLFLYSSHEITIITLLKIFKVNFENCLPNFLSSIIIELHKIADNYFIRVKYNSTSNILHPSYIQDYNFCTFLDFVETIKQYFPDNNEDMPEDFSFIYDFDF